MAKVREKKEIDKYNPTEIEAKWQKYWQDNKTYQPDLDTAKKPFYNLMMFPYPSAEGMHVGNMYAFTGSDVYGRFMRMKGNDVFEPIGLDGFGIHSENYALKVGKHPKEQAKKSEENFYRQLREIGNAFAWDNKVETYDSHYYKWTQWVFIQLFKSGLAYKKKASVNFCPSCKTVLADEQVISGNCERCETEVINKDLEQWFFKITDYADRLLNNIDKLNWTEKIKIAQRQWIGRSEGVIVNFQLKRDCNFVLLHGFTGNPKADFHPWVKKHLEEKGYKVQVPRLPDSDNPTEEGQVGYVLKNVKFDENTILLGYSLGSVVALKVLEKLDKKIAGLVLVAGFIEPKFLDHDRPFKDTFEWKFDFEKIKKQTGFIKILNDNSDTAVPQDQGEALKGKLSGELVEFEAEEAHVTADKEPKVLRALIPSIEVFTTRPDTLHGATFMVLSPEHPLVQQIEVENKEVEEYINKTHKKSKQERIAMGKEISGVDTCIIAINPVSKKEIPVWIAEYVLMDYGTGAIMAVPAHDKRDFEFAKKYNLPIKFVIKPVKEDVNFEKPYIGSGEIINSGIDWNDYHVPDAISKIIDDLEKKGIGKRQTQYHLRDWLISRQRYWGPPIPMINCQKCGWQTVPEKDLPVLLPDVENWKPIGAGKSPLATIEDFVKTTCPKCEGPAERETDVSDTFLDSSWYFFRYISTDKKDTAFNKERVGKWLPVDMYIGGAEHAVLHLLYSRFITMVFKDLNLIDFEEPYLRFRANGLLIKEGAKMSKSKGNVVIPDEYIKKFGADTLRLYLMFLGPYFQGGDFYDTGMEGIYRFLKRVWKISHVELSGSISNEGMKMMHKTIKKVTKDIQALRYNTAIASIMEYYNFLSKEQTVSKVQIKTLILLISPLAPHISEELWEVLGEEKSIHNTTWPTFDDRFLIEKKSKIAVQVNGKVRDILEVDSEDIGSKQKVENIARESQKVEKYLANRPIQDIIYVPGRVINFVISNGKKPLVEKFYQF